MIIVMHSNKGNAGIQLMKISDSKYALEKLILKQKVYAKFECFEIYFINNSFRLILIHKT